jgi:membrane AbrB-like protein
MKNIETLPLNKENFKDLFSLNFLIILIISFPSAIIAEYLKIPLAWMLGPMLAISIAALSGLKLKMPTLALSMILIVLGLYIGNYIDEKLLYQTHKWIGTSAIMFIYIMVCIIFVSKYLEKFAKYEKKTSFFSAAPGGLGPLVMLAEHEKSDISQVATSHLIRLIVIITVFPFVVDQFANETFLADEEFNFLEQNHYHLIYLILSSLVLIFLFDRLKVPAPLLSGTLVASGILQILNLAYYQLPSQSIDFGLLILGASVGCRFAGKTLHEVYSNTKHSVVATLLLVIFSVIAAVAASFVIDKNFFSLLLAYCPGGIYEVAVIAIAFDLDPEFVAFHHIIRLLMILFIVPVIVKVVKKK